MYEKLKLKIEDGVIKANAVIDNVEEVTSKSGSKYYWINCHFTDEDGYFYPKRFINFDEASSSLKEGDLVEFFFNIFENLSKLGDKSFTNLAIVSMNIIQKTEETPAPKGKIEVPEGEPVEDLPF